MSVFLASNLSEKGEYTITADMKEKLVDFAGGYATEEQTAGEIAKVYADTGYVLDPHTAVASYVRRSVLSDDPLPAVVASTASPYKFTRSVMQAIDGAKYESMEDFELVDELCKLSKVEIPYAVESIRTAPILHKTICEKDEMRDVVINRLIKS